MRRHVLLVALLCASLGAIVPRSSNAEAAAADTHVPHSGGFAKDSQNAQHAQHASDTAENDAAQDASAGSSPLLATLVQTHTGERVLLDASSPTSERFDALLADRTTGERAHGSLDPRLVDLLRQLASDADGDGVVDRTANAGAAPVRIELVSGYRSPKLNEMLRKKGHHVASHSQHSLGHACDFRLIPAGETEPVEPSEMRRRIRALGWNGGVGIYPTKNDRFVHADVGPNRSWLN